MKKIISLIINICKFILAVLAGLIVIGIIFFGIEIIFRNTLPATSRAVLSNFIVFLGIIVFLSEKKIRPIKAIVDAQNAINETITESETAKTESEERLHTIEDSMAHIEDEINAIIEKSEENAKLVGEKIIKDGENTALIIQENTGKALENSRTILRNELLKRASLASVEVARAHIVNELSWNQGLHDKLINESIEAIEGAEL